MTAYLHIVCCKYYAAASYVYMFFSLPAVVFHPTHRNVAALIHPAVSLWAEIPSQSDQKQPVALTSFAPKPFSPLHCLASIYQPYLFPIVAYTSTHGVVLSFSCVFVLRFCQGALELLTSPLSSQSFPTNARRHLKCRRIPPLGSSQTTTSVLMSALEWIRWLRFGITWYLHFSRTVLANTS